MSLFCGCSISSKVTGAYKLAERDSDLKHEQAISTTSMVETVEAEVFGMLTLMDADSLTCACGILGLDVPEQKKGNRKLLLKYISR